MPSFGEMSMAICRVPWGHLGWSVVCVFPKIGASWNLKHSQQRGQTKIHRPAWRPKNNGHWQFCENVTFLGMTSLRDPKSKVVGALHQGNKKVTA